jgi:hypothetical protein
LPHRGITMIRSRRSKVLLAALPLAASLTLPAIALAGQKFHRPPDVDLDPDRGMPFDRLPKKAFDGRELDTQKKLLTLHVMDPDIDPYSLLVKPSTYESATGQIRGSLTDEERAMRHEEDLERQFSGADKTVTRSSVGPTNPLAGMPKVARVRPSRAVDPVAALKKQQANDAKHDPDDD